MSLERDGFGKDSLGIDFFMTQVRHPQLKDSNGQKASIAKLFEQGRKLSCQQSIT